MVGCKRKSHQNCRSYDAAKSRKDAQPALALLVPVSHLCGVVAPTILMRFSLTTYHWKALFKSYNLKKNLTHLRQFMSLKLIILWNYSTFTEKQGFLLYKLEVLITILWSNFVTTSHWPRRPILDSKCSTWIGQSKNPCNIAIYYSTCSNEYTYIVSIAN